MRRGITIALDIYQQPRVLDRKGTMQKVLGEDFLMYVRGLIGGV